MLFLLEQYFKDSPTRKKIVEGLFNRGISVKGGKFFCGSIEISPSQVATALGVNRRTVYETLKQIEDNEAWIMEINISLLLLWDHRSGGDDPIYTGLDIQTKIILCKTPDENGNAARKCGLENGSLIQHIATSTGMRP